MKDFTETIMAFFHPERYAKMEAAKYPSVPVPVFVNGPTIIIVPLRDKVLRGDKLEQCYKVIGLFNTLEIGLGIELTGKWVKHALAEKRVNILIVKE